MKLIVLCSLIIGTLLLQSSIHENAPDNMLQVESQRHYEQWRRDIETRLGQSSEMYFNILDAGYVDPPWDRE